MKKTISLLLSLVMLLSVTAGINFSAFADEIKSISFSLQTPIELTEGDNGYYRTDSNGDRYFNYYLNLDGCLYEVGNTFTVTTSSGSTVYTYKQNGENWWDTDWYDDDGNALDGYFDDEYDDQGENHWTVGTNYATVAYKGVTTQIPVKIVKSNVQSISLTLAKPIQLMEGIDGFYRRNYDDDSDSYFDYDYSIPDGSKLTVVTDSGTAVYTYECGDLYDSNNEYRGNIQKDDDQSSDNPWSVGTHYFTASYKGASTQVKVEVVKSNVRSITYTPTEPIEIPEYEDGWYDNDSNGNRFYWYSYDVEQESAIVTITTDDNVYNYQFFYPEEDDPYWSLLGDWDDDAPKFTRWNYSVDDDQQTNHWGIGTHYATLSYGGVTTTIPVEIVNNNIDVKSISYTPVKTQELKSLVDGEYTEDNNGNRYFHYYYRKTDIGDKLTVTTSSGTTEYTCTNDEYVEGEEFDYEEYGYGNYFVDENGNRFPYRLDSYDDQITNHWQTGTNYYTLFIGNIETQVPVNVVEADPSHEHIPGEAKRENVVSATCSQKGSYDEVTYCTECGIELTRETKEINKIKHISGEAKQENVVAATCATEGSYDEVVYCKKCGEEVSREKKTVNKSAHIIVTDSAYPATFTAAGKTEGSHCFVCGTVITKQNAIAKLGSPALTKLKKGKKSFTAQWSAANGVDGYQIQYSLKKNFKKATTKYSKGTKLTAKKLKSKKTYYVRVRAYKNIGGKNVYSAWSTKKVKVK